MLRQLYKVSGTDEHGDSCHPTQDFRTYFADVSISQRVSESEGGTPRGVSSPECSGLVSGTGTERHLTHLDCPK